jgi:hypothetical protein
MTKTQTPRTATVAVSKNLCVHAASGPVRGGYILACNGRWMDFVAVWTDNAAKVLESEFACTRCVAALASGRVVLAVAS